MRHIRVLICQVDAGTPALMSELACFDLATPDVATLRSRRQPSTPWRRRHRRPATPFCAACCTPNGTRLMRPLWRGIAPR